MKYSVIQWSSGNVGKHAIASVAAAKHLKLKGVYVYDPAKVGLGAGEIAGVGPLGARATGDFDKLLAMDADCVIHTPLPSLIYGDNPDEDLDVICALLASGKNVVTTVGYLYPKAHGAKVVRRLEAACRRGGSTYHSTGVNPGWMGDMLPLMLSGMSQTIDKIHVLEITNFQFYPSPQVIFDMMGFGLTPAQFKTHTVRYRHWLCGLFRESIEMVADGPRGHHSLTVSGRPDMYVDFGPTWNNDVLLSTAARAVNAVPLVCEAPSGIATLLDLPMVVGGQVVGGQVVGGQVGGRCRR